MKFIRNLLGAAALCAAGMAPAMAQNTTFDNGTFVGGLSGWAKTGDVSVNPAGSAVLSTAFIDEFFNFSGISAVDVSDLEFFTGLNAGTLINNGGQEGSALKRSFDVLAGDSIDVAFTFGLATLDADAAAFNDFAFMAVNGQFVKVASLTDGVLAGNFNYTFQTGGSAELAFGVVDVNDVTGVSYFILDNIQVTAVPEPETYAMLLAGLALMGGMARRRKA